MDAKGLIRTWMKGITTKWLHSHFPANISNFWRLLASFHLLVKRRSAVNSHMCMQKAPEFINPNYKQASGCQKAMEGSKCIDK